LVSVKVFALKPWPRLGFGRSALALLTPQNFDITLSLSLLWFLGLSLSLEQLASTLIAVSSHGFGLGLKSSASFNITGSH